MKREILERAIEIVVNAACILLLVAASATAQSRVRIVVNALQSGPRIPQDFNGLSFETLSLRYDNAGVKGYLFDSSDKELLTLFRELGIRNLRIGGSSVDANKYDYTPSRKDIDALFRFAKAAGVRVIYSLRLLDGNSLKDASAAKYIWDRYRKYLVCFAIGNEPNLYRNKDPEITGLKSYLAKWRRFAKTIRDSVPDAVFGGPDNDTGGSFWGRQFAHYEFGSGIVTGIFFHYYVGGTSKHKSASQLIDAMLSLEWDKVNYPERYEASGAVALKLGFPYRLTESNCNYTPRPGVWGGNNSFATALFALDYMHWWADHGCSGVNFHSAQWKYNATIYRDSSGNFQVYPIGFGIKAFDIGGHGRIDRVRISKPAALNLTAYAVTGKHNLYVTIINKGHSTGAAQAIVNIVHKGFTGKSLVMYLEAPDGNAGATSGITLGGASINDYGGFKGKWKRINAISPRRCEITVPAASAAIVKIGKGKQ